MWIVNLALLAGITYSVVQFARNPRLPAPAVGPRGSVVVAEVDHGERTVGQAEKIRAAHLFGRAARTPAPDQVPVQAPATRLHLVLKGVLSAARARDSRAIIAAGRGGAQSAYATGSKLPGGATIARIYPDRLILSHGGRYETLFLEKPGRRRQRDRR